jgi:nucleoside-diphosphate-sugar epimerase
MKIVVTGGSGKVGKYLLPELLAANHEVASFDQVAPTVKGVRWIRGNLQDLAELMWGLTGAEAVIHLAAFPIPYREIPDHVLFSNNVIGTYNVHEAAFRLGIRRVVSASSGAIVGWAYGDREVRPKYLPIDEAHPVMPHDPYGLSKLCGEEIARSYTFKCDMETVVLRPAWVVFPEMAEQLRRNGGRKATKFDVFTHIDPRDLATALRQAAQIPGLKHEIFFIVADDSTVGEPLCDLLPRLMPGLGDMAKTLTGERCGISNEKAKRLLQWQPKHSWRRPD